MSPKLLKSIEKLIKEMTEQEGVISMTNDEINQYLKTVSYNMDILSKLKKFKDKKIIITNKLDVSNTPIKSLGPIIKVIGGLDISRTEISDISNVEVQGYVHDGGTPIARKREAIRRAEILRGIEQRREDKAFEMTENAGELAIKANALFEFLLKEYNVEGKSPEDQEEIQSLRDQIQKLESRMEDLPEEDKEEYQEEIDDMESEISEIENKVDVYFLVPQRYTHYGLTCFISEIEDHENEEWCIGNGDEMDEAAKEYWDNYVDEMGSEGFYRRVLEDHLDMDRLRSDIEDVYENDIRDNLDSYLSDDDRELSDSQKKHIQRLEKDKSEFELRLHDLEPGNDEYDEVNNRIEKIDSEIDEIKESPEGEYKEEAIEDKISDTVEYYVDNYNEYLSNMGSDISDYLDKDSLVEYLASNEGYGALSSYDSNYEYLEFNDETYYIIRQS